MKVAKDYYSKNWNRYEKVYKMFMESKTGEDSWRATLPDTWAFATIKTAQAAFADSNVVPIISRHEDEDQRKSEDLRDLYTDISEKGTLNYELYFARLDSFKLGMGFLKTIYIKDERRIHKIDSYDAETEKIIYKKDDQNDFDDPKTIRVSPYLMYVDDMARADWTTARDCAEIEVLGFDQAKEKYAHYIGDAAWDERIKKAGQATQFTQESQTSTVAVDTNNLRTNRTSNEFKHFAPFELSPDHVVVIHYWNKGITTPSGCQDSYEIIINGEPIVVDTKKTPAPIPYIHKQLPFSPIPYSPYSGDEFWAAGIIEISQAEAEAVQLHREMMSDRQKLSLFSPAFSDMNDEIDQRVLKLKPLSIIRTKGGAPKQFQVPGITNADIQVKDDYEMSLKRAVGIDERILGVSTDTARLTATEVGFLREAALKRLREFVSFCYKPALLREMKLKFKVIEQYYASPAKQASRLKNDSKDIEAKAKQFKIKIGNVYRNKNVNPNFFEGSIDCDLDMQTLLPMTDAQMVTTWSQVLRDTMPFIQAGLIQLDVEKILEKYLNALQVNINTLKIDTAGDSITLAEGEHRWLADENTSDAFLQLYPEGTDPQFLTPEHIKRHRELLEGDDTIDEKEMKNVALHIAKDMQAFQIKMQQQPTQPQQVNPQSLAQVGGIVPQMQQINPQQLAQQTK